MSERTCTKCGRGYTTQYYHHPGLCPRCVAVLRREAAVAANERRRVERPARLAARRAAKVREQRERVAALADAEMQRSVAMVARLRSPDVAVVPF